jgi:hypothetical protein
MRKKDERRRMNERKKEREREREREREKEREIGFREGKNKFQSIGNGL